MSLLLNLLLGMLLFGVACPSSQTAAIQAPIYETRRDHDPEGTGKF